MCYQNIFNLFGVFCQSTWTPNTMPTVKTDKQMICGFCKYLSEAKGVYGVFTYDIFKNVDVYSHVFVPFDRNIFENYFACDATLLIIMSYVRIKKSFAKGCLHMVLRAKTILMLLWICFFFVFKTTGNYRNNRSNKTGITDKQ